MRLRNASWSWCGAPWCRGQFSLSRGYHRQDGPGPEEIRADDPLHVGGSHRIGAVEVLLERVGNAELGVVLIEPIGLALYGFDRTKEARLRGVPGLLQLASRRAVGGEALQFLVDGVLQLRDGVAGAGHGGD